MENMKKMEELFASIAKVECLADIFNDATGASLNDIVGDEGMKTLVQIGDTDCIMSILVEISKAYGEMLFIRAIAKHIGNDDPGQLKVAITAKPQSSNDVDDCDRQFAVIRHGEQLGPTFSSFADANKHAVNACLEMGFQRTEVGIIELKGNPIFD